MTRPYLILVLQAPLIAYGGEAVDRKRPSDLIPGKSMLTGLLGNAIGYRRHDADQLASLQERLRYAARTERLNPTYLLRDFHTAQLGADDTAWTTYGAPEGRAGSPASYQGPETREVDYLTETRSVVALTLADSEQGPTLTEAAEAIRNPARPLFIGRKCCLPERPIFERMVNAESDTEALCRIAPDTGATDGQIQWDGSEQHESVRKTHELWVSDLKDWRNGVHVGRRMVNRGIPLCHACQADLPGV